jgi:ABC-type enterobactin transport system permease subunit
MPLFNVLIERPGFYSLSALYKGAATGPTVPILFFAQSAQNVAFTLMVGGFFFLVFLGLGIFVLIKSKKN